MLFIDKPSPPKGPLEISGMTETSCTIKWHVPENDGGTPILDYTVERKETSKKAWHKVSSFIIHQFIGCKYNSFLCLVFMVYHAYL